MKNSFLTVSRWLSNENSQSIKARLQIILDSGLFVPLFRLISCLMAYPSYKHDPSIILLFIHLFYYFKTMFEKDFIFCLRFYIANILSYNIESSNTSHWKEFDDYNQCHYDDSHQDIYLNISSENTLSTNIPSKPNDQATFRNLINNADVHLKNALPHESSQFYSEFTNNTTNSSSQNNTFTTNDCKANYERSSDFDLEQSDHHHYLDADSEHHSSTELKENNIESSSTDHHESRKRNTLEDERHLKLMKDKKCVCSEHKDILYVLTSHNIYYLVSYVIPYASLLFLSLFSQNT